MDIATEKREIVDIYSANGQRRGTADRSTVHKNAMIHRTVRVWLVHGSAAYFQRRSKSKPLVPGRLDPCATGHAGAGEDPLDAALREFHEETGTEIRPDDLVLAGLLPMPFRRPEGTIDDELAWIYVYSPDAMPELRATDETDGFEAVPLEEYRAMLDGKGCTHKAADFCSPDPVEFGMVIRAIGRIAAEVSG